jgi:hypothetical protein
MAGGKRRTTMAKLNRERKLLERRAAKQAKKDARKKARAGEGSVVGRPAPEEVEQPPGDLPA